MDYIITVNKVLFTMYNQNSNQIHDLVFDRESVPAEEDFNIYNEVLTHSWTEHSKDYHNF